jgi:leukotriene-A4 hydrolase
VDWTKLNAGTFGGKNPDSIFSKVPYEKGFQFLAYLETLVGADAM